MMRLLVAAVVDVAAVEYIVVAVMAGVFLGVNGVVLADAVFIAALVLAVVVVYCGLVAVGDDVVAGCCCC